MAYLDFADPVGTAASSIAFPAARAGKERTLEFTALHWRVIRLARADSLSSLREETGFDRFLRLLFSWDRKRPLADPTLEALRRMAVMSWHYGYNVQSSEIEDFVAAGYSLEQYETLLDHIGKERALTVSRRTRR